MKAILEESWQKAVQNQDPLNKSLNATPKLCLELSPGFDQTAGAFADWARVNSMLDPLGISIGGVSVAMDLTLCELFVCKIRAFASG